METPTDPSVGPIINSDRTGRTRYTSEYKHEVLDAFESSGLSGPVFARQCGIKYPTFTAWLAKRRKEDRSPSCYADRPAFVIAELSGEAADDPALEVRLALPRRVFTLSQLKFVEDRIAWLYENRELVGGLKFVDEPKVLRIFVGRLAPSSDWTARLVAKFREHFGDSL